MNRATIPKNSDFAQTLNQIVLAQIPRVLGFGNRTDKTETVGCFDRYYWHYKLHDLPNTRFQEVAHLLALLYATPHCQPYTDNQNILKWMGQAIDYWTSCLHADGSVDEIYPNERSYCATAFSTFAITEALLLLNPSMGISTDVQKALNNVGKWLTREPAFPIANQWAAAAAALFNIAKLLNQSNVLAAANTQIDRVESLMDTTGGFREYDGPDVGYQTITLSVLRGIEQRVTDSRITKLRRQGLAWLNQQLDSDGQFDPSTYSRGTRYLYLYGTTADEDSGRDIQEKVLRGIRQDSIQHPGWLDDRYVIPYLTDYLCTFRHLTNNEGNQ